MRRLILVAATPNRFHQDHGIPLGHWVITDPQLQQVFAHKRTVTRCQIIDAGQGAMRYNRNNDRETVFLTNPCDPAFQRIVREADRARWTSDNLSSYGPLFKLETEFGPVRWFVSTVSARGVLRGMPLVDGYRFKLGSRRVQTDNWSYWVPEVTDA